eukprot:8282-Heterococcus_DN1.PRE.2
MRSAPSFITCAHWRPSLLLLLLLLLYYLQELESKLKAAETALDDLRQRYRAATRAAQRTGEALSAEAAALRNRELNWERQTAHQQDDLDAALARCTAAEQQLEGESAARTGLEVQVEALQALLKRSREAIDAFRAVDSTATTTASAAAACAALQSP